VNKLHGAELASTSAAFVSPRSAEGLP
jgi:hypothetical protein